MSTDCRSGETTSPAEIDYKWDKEYRKGKHNYLIGQEKSSNL
jgi:hypothetical protein